jgi:hypothetical protein
LNEVIEPVVVFEAPLSAVKPVQTPPELALDPCVTVSVMLSANVLVCANELAVA